MKYPKEFEEFEKTSSCGQVRVLLSYIGEGRSGDYDPEDPDDVPLLRYDLDRKEDDKWIAVENGSYCTELPTSISRHEAELAASIILDNVADLVKSNKHKRMCEKLSWLNTDSLRKRDFEKNQTEGCDELTP